MVFERAELDRARHHVLKRRRIVVITSLSVLFLVLVFLGLYKFTDVILGVSEDLQSVSESGNWAMFRHDMSRTGSLNPDDILPRGDVKWTFTTEGAINSSPAVVDGVVYVGSRDSHVYALKADTGEKLWEFKAGSWVESSPVVVDGTVYIGSNDGFLYALDARTGTVRWSFRTAYAVRSSAAVADGVVYFGSDDYYFYAVDAATGKLHWKFATDTQVTSSPVVTDGIAVFGSSDGMFYCLNARNGRPRLKYQTHSTVVSSPVVSDSVAYFPDTSGYLFAVNIQARNWPFENTLDVFWKALYIYGTAPHPPSPSGYVWIYKMGPKARQASSPALVENTLYLGAGNNLLSLDIDNQQPVWSFETKDSVTSSPAVTDKAVFFGSQDGRFYVLDRATGEKLWDFPTGGQITSSPALADGVIYVGSHDGKLYAFE
jgi:outer membrane protein assembly factor BamB